MQKNTPYDPTQNYLYTAIDFDKIQNGANNHDPDLFMQIDGRLGKNKTHMGAVDGEHWAFEEKNLGYTGDQKNRWWYNWCIKKIMIMDKNRQVSAKQMIQMQQQINDETQGTPLYAFITVNMDDKKIAQNEIRYAQQVKEIAYSISHKSYGQGVVKNCEYVIERFRRDDKTNQIKIHNHIHFLFTFYKTTPPSNMITKILAAKGVKEYCSADNFVDYRGPQNPRKPYAPYPVCCQYVRGMKTDEKLDCIQMDRTWRDENNIDHLYCV